jgi:hypothetical protein
MPITHELSLPPFPIFLSPHSLKSIFPASNGHRSPATFPPTTNGAADGEGDTYEMNFSSIRFRCGSVGPFFSLVANVLLRGFPLKPELLRASDLGFEHPSEGKLSG